MKVSPWEHSQEVCTWIISGWEQVADHVIASGINKAEILVAENTSKADNKFDHGFRLHRFGKEVCTNGDIEREDSADREVSCRGCSPSQPKRLDG